MAAKDWKDKQKSVKPPQSLSAPEHYITPCSDSAQLADFIAEFRNVGCGSYDTSFLLNFNHKPAHEQPGHRSPAAERAPCSSCNLSVLEAIVTQTVPESIQTLPGLGQAIVTFSNHAEGNPDQLLLVTKGQYTLGDVLRFSPEALHNDEQRRTMLFEILLTLQAIHAEGLSLGTLSPDHVWFTHGRQGLFSPRHDSSIPTLSPPPQHTCMTLALSQLHFMLD